MYFIRYSHTSFVFFRGLFYTLGRFAVALTWLQVRLTVGWSCSLLSIIISSY